MAKIVLLLVLATVVCVYAFPTTETEISEDLIQPEVVRSERAASPVASANPDPWRGGGGHYKHHDYHYPHQYHHHYPKRGCRRCGHRG